MAAAVRQRDGGDGGAGCGVNLPAAVRDAGERRRCRLHRRPGQLPEAGSCSTEIGKLYISTSEIISEII